ncbi:MAG: 3-phosphoshikimate 1-carboxyvinyltransferase [Bacteroidetes bacterium]|nr:3-phosphoshikimate 1-carboxyvinyltransferase [Bacteroidota bacterium]
MHYKISKDNRNLVGEINLPASKSISNRLLIIQALNYSLAPITNLSQSDDTKIIYSVLNSNTNNFDVANSGTAMRFLTAFLSKIVGEWTITGSDRMKERPIGELVKALRELGANIEYLENEGFPPLKILGSNLTGKTIELDANISSQFISALLLIAPTLKNGLTIKLNGKIVSKPYINLTLNILKQFGIKSTFINNTITINNQPFSAKDFSVEADWSAASYWYEMAAFADKVDLKLYGLNKNSLQGDSAVAKIFKNFGVKTTFINNGIHLTKEECNIKKFNIDLIDYPDLAQTIVVTCSFLKIPFKISGLETLKIKETNRINALISELSKFNIKLTETSDGVLECNDFQHNNIDKYFIDTHSDHRMALSFAPISILNKKIIFDNIDVINKSYPAFYEDLKRVGFKISEE